MQTTEQKSNHETTTINADATGHEPDSNCYSTDDGKNHSHHQVHPAKTNDDVDTFTRHDGTLYYKTKSSYKLNFGLSHNKHTILSVLDINSLR